LVIKIDSLSVKRGAVVATRAQAPGVFCQVA